MLYTIGEKVVFSSDDGAVWNIEDENDKVTLTPSVSRLLILLLEKRGTVVTRDEIFQQVWDHWGKEGSNNSLNNYISQLRKLVSHYGVNPDIIETVPRIGFLFRKDEVIVQDEIVPEDDKAAPQKPKSVPRTFWLYTLVCVLAIFSAFAVYKAIKSASADIKPVYLDAIDQCSVYELSPGGDINIDSIKNTVRKIVDEKKIDCSKNKVIFFQADKLIYSNLKGRFYLAACFGSYQRFNMCINYVDTDTVVAQ